MKQNFYRAFEDRFRGSRETIRDRLFVYTPFLKALHTSGLSNAAVDLGCGRGEWLEVLESNGFHGIGVDIDDAMLSACRELGLEVRTGDAIEYLKQLPESSLGLVSAFHLVEHIGFENLLALVQEALRVLQPGGLLILETPNPENLSVGTNSFYLDPTHERPIPPELLAFIADFEGFARSKIVRLQETTSLLHEESPTLMAVLNGASPDYAVVAQKSGDLAKMAALEPEFARDYGLRVDTLAVRYHNQVLGINANAQNAQAEALQARNEAQNAQAEALQAFELAQEAMARVEAIYGHAQGLETRLQGVLTSRSWRITSPMRWMGAQMRLLKDDGLKSRLKAFFKKVMRGITDATLQRPALRRIVVRWAGRLGLLGTLKSLHRRFYPRRWYDAAQSFQSNLAEDPQSGTLSERAREVYSLLIQDEARQKKGQC